MELAKQTQGVYVWHLLTSPSEVCLCRFDPRFGANRDVRHPRGISDLQEHRHVLGSCSSTQNFLNELDIDGGSGHDFEGKEIDPSAIALDTSSPQNSSFPDAPGTARSSDQTTEREKMSIDSEMLSIPDSDDMKCTRSLGPDDPLSPIIDVVAGRLLLEYRSLASSVTAPDTSFSVLQMVAASEASSRMPDDGEAQPDSSGNSPSSNNTTANSGGSGGSGKCTSKSSGKRPYSDVRSDEASDCDGSMPPPKRGKQVRSDVSSKSLACPFWKLNPVKHRACFKSELSKINRVKQHLSRKHTPALYCDRCLVVFPDIAGYQYHLTQHCIFDASATLDGISHHQHRELSKKSKPGLAESEQWFKIWDIVFPTASRPSSAYIDDSLSEDIYHYREHARTRGPQILFEELQANGILSGILSPEDIASHVESAVTRGLDRLFEDWLSSLSLRPPPGALDSRVRSARPEYTTADSGVDLGSQPEIYPALSRTVEVPSAADLLSRQSRTNQELYIATEAIEQEPVPYSNLSLTSHDDMVILNTDTHEGLGDSVFLDTGFEDFLESVDWSLV